MVDSSQAGIEQHPTIMTLEEVAKYLRVHKSTVYRMAREGSIPSSKVANQWRFRKARIDEWLMERENEGAIDC
ncbi:MAG: helix-turn-helix domain-containing protein [Acidobacteriota bacterium]|jgi:excisionase family DNA binding protein|nr:DNA-binding protein [Acidobacteriota bacterium]MED5560097.1 helix-turn-helix domain-containing protein [Acidobacteriota bacterium]MEE2648809.1 helix-turn-helix domain-containing protein [Acidobacteriota bacterium]|tara:strand:+ start:1453 stop:1671 length:219 start_codon:yes stop_codon:yes gene_type:complete